MTVTDDKDLSKIIGELDRRVSEVEQTVTSPTIMGGEFPGGISIGGESGDPVVIDYNPPEAPTGISVTVGSVFDNIYADVEWSAAVTGPLAQNFILVWAQGDDGALPIGSAIVAGTSYRIENLEPNTDYSVRIMPSSNIGVLGTPSGWENFTTGTDTTIPPAPTGVTVGRGATTVVVKYTPLTALEARDVANGAGIYEIQIDTSTAFNTGNLRSARSGDQIVAFPDVLAEGTWYARVRAIDSSGNVSLWSSTAGPATAGGVIDSMIVAGLDAAKITFGSMSGSRITTNTLAADRIATGTITAATITLTSTGFLWAGTGLGGGSATGVVLAGTGLALYKAGAITVLLDAATGNASFVGTVSASTITGSTISGTNINGGYVTGSVVRTAATNYRVVLDNVPNLYSSGETPHLFFYPALDSAGVGPAEIYAYWNAGTSSGSLVVEGPDAYSSQCYLDLHSSAGGGDVTIRGSRNIQLWSDDVDIVGSGHLTVNGGAVINNGLQVFGTKSFRTPHPLLEGKDLIHSAVEGPENGIFYRGVGKTKNKKATIELPDYFEKLRGDHFATVHVTPRDTPTGMCATDVKNGKFRVSAQEDCEFSWLVFAARGDIEPLVTEDDRLLPKELPSVERPSRN